MNPLLAAVLLTGTMASSSAAAQRSGPPPADLVQTMLEAAIAGGNAGEVDTVAKYAKRAQPGQAAAIDAMVSGWKTKVQERKLADLRNADLFERWDGEGQLGFSRTTGNSSDIGLNAGLRLEREGADWTHELRSQVDYQKSNGTVTRERAVAALESQYRFDDRRFAFGQAQFERDRIQGIAQRYALSGGVGWTVLDRADLRLSLKGGPAYRRTRYRTGRSEDVLTGLLALDGRWSIADGLTVTERAESFIATDNSTFSSTTALDARLIGALSARLSYTLDYQTEPQPGRVDLNTLSRASLVYDF